MFAVGLFLPTNEMILEMSEPVIVEEGKAINLGMEELEVGNGDEEPMMGHNQEKTALPSEIKVSNEILDVPKTEAPINEDFDKIKEIVESKAEEYGVDKELAIDLCMYEAKGCQPEIKNPNSSATGLFQFVDKTWDGLCKGERTNPTDNADCAMRLISEGGISHWTADLNTRKVLIDKGYVECPAPERNYCILKPHLITAI